MPLSPALRKLWLTFHLISSIGWIGAALAFVPLAVVGVRSSDREIVRGACVGMHLIASYVIVPLALGAFATGLVSALGTSWGLFRHYWVVVKLILTTVAMIVLMVQLAPIAELARTGGGPDIARPLVHSVGGLIVLVAIQLLGVYKPRGLTHYGWRKEHQRSSGSSKA